MLQRVESTTNPDRLSVLVADDNLCDILLLTHGFEAAGIPATIHPAASGGEVLSYLSENAVPDVVVLDFALPDQSGLDLFRSLEHECQCPHVGKVLLSGLLPFTQSQAESDGILCLEKPCLLEEWANVASRIAAAAHPVLPDAIAA